MNLLAYVAHFFGGMFLFNAFPHFVSGITGHAFQTPFAKPPGKGLSSSAVNVVWGFMNFAIAYVLLVLVAVFAIQDLIDVIITGLGGFLISIFCARHFGQFHGGKEVISKP